MPRKPTIFIHQQMFEVDADSDLITSVHRCPRKSAAPVRNKVGNAMLNYVSVVNSLMGALPIVGHMKMLVDVLCRSWMD